MKGTIDTLEFKEGLESLNVLKDYPLSDLQIKQLFKYIDKDGNGKIEYAEFLSSFEVMRLSSVK